MRTIALIEIGNDGHREAYMRYFIAALLGLDCRIICLMPDITAVKLWVDLQFPEKKELVVYSPMPFYREKFRHAGRLKERFNILYNWHRIGQTLRSIEKDQCFSVDLVFFNFLDAFLINYTPAAVLDKLLGKKWSGIYFFPAFLRLAPALLNVKTSIGNRDYILSAKNCVAAGFHDEGILERFSNRLGGKKVLLFPEIADLSPPDESDPYRLQIRNLSKGRIVVGNIGLEKHKGNYEMMQLAKQADPASYFFVFTGRDDGTLFDFLTGEQEAELKEFIQHLPENCLWQPAVFLEGAQYNAVLSAFDIVYMIYTHFYGASNRLTKAAYFQKLILADNKYCIGDTVRQYDLGEAVPDTDPETLVAALGRLKQRISEQDLPIKNWQAILDLNSQESLKRQFRELVDLI